MTKTMRYFSIAALALMGAVMTGCSNNDELQQPESGKRTVTLTTTVSLDGGAGTRALDVSTGVKTFEVDDQISFVYKDIRGDTKLAVSEKLTQSDISADGKTATIYVLLEDPATDSQLRMIYPATMANIPMSTSATIDDAGTINLEALQSGQQGYEGELSDYDLAVFDGTLTGYALPASVTLANKLAICAFTIKNADGTQDITTTITNLTISDGTYNYSISRSNLISPIYVAMMPVADANITMTATDNDGQHYAKSLTNITYAANNIYPLAMRMTESFKTYSTLPAGTHLNVGDQLDLSSYFLINGDVSEQLTSSYAPYTLVKANVEGSTVTEADDGAYYVFKDKNGDFYGKDAGLHASAASDGIFVAGYYEGMKSYTMLSHVNLANVTTAYTAQTYDCLYGTLGSNVQISIADNAVVWLGGVSINADGTMTGEYAGITCRGNATINLADGTTNTVRGMADDYSGIFVPHNDTGEGDDEYTLTIRGTGTLNAFGGQNSAGIGANSRYDSGNIVIAGGIINATGGGNAAGIGSSYVSTSDRNYTCGNITISGGTVTATGGCYAAGIGSAHIGGCGKININGGTVTASGGSKAAGIGSGEGGSCGNITIENTVTSVTAIKGENANESIGRGSDGSCGMVTIGGTVYYDGSNFQNDGDTYLATSPLVYSAP